MTSFEGTTPRLSSTSNRPWLGIVFLAALAAIVFTAMGWVRFSAYRAGYWDLGFFDQGVYLLTQPGRAVLVDGGFHVLADHAAVILCPISLLYRIYPSVLWLLAVQAIALAGGAVLVWQLARDAGISPRMAFAIGGSWLVYPAVIMPNLHDFHPEAISIPAILGIVLFARRNRPFLFALCLALSLTNKEGLSLTVGALGLWLAIFDRRVAFGVVTFIAAAIWFVIATRIIIPHFGQGHELNSYRFLSYLGDSPGQILRAMAAHPSLLIKQLATTSTLVYCGILLVPVWWGLAPRHLSPLIGAIPCVAINLLSNEDYFRNAFYHYSMPVSPFVFLAVIAAVSAGASWIKQPWKIGVWILLVLVAGGAMRFHHSSEQGKLNEAQIVERNKLVKIIGSDEGVLTTHQISAQLAHRRLLWVISDPVPDTAPWDLSGVNWVLLDFKEEALKQVDETGLKCLTDYQHNPDFATVYSKDDLYLFHRKSAFAPIAAGSTSAH